ncbi:hypothetical protein N9K77_01960 [bacterium]|nr:hypothetical protein [bacterium]
MHLLKLALTPISSSLVIPSKTFNKNSLFYVIYIKDNSLDGCCPLQRRLLFKKAFLAVLSASFKDKINIKPHHHESKESEKIDIDDDLYVDFEEMDEKENK